MNDDEIVKIRKSDLQALINANVEAYNLLDEISSSLIEVDEGVKRAFRKLEDVPEVSDMIIEEDEEDEKEEV